MPSHLYANPSCGTCSYFAAGSSTSGTCQRYPPTTMLSSTVLTVYIWPTVSNANWCGEYEEL